MRFSKLNLIAFGPFSNVSLEFNTNDNGLQLLFGPNEAGKSSVLRGLTQLLFGIPTQSADNFLHDYRSMRIGACIEMSGQFVECIRRKGNKETLRAGDDTTPIDEKVFFATLSSIDAHAFNARFGINRDSLIRGGRDLSQSGGELAEVLFSAGSGLSNLKAVQTSLESEANVLFKKGGSLPRINELLKQLQDVKEIIKLQSLRPEKWTELQSAITCDTAELQRSRKRQLDLQAEILRMDRLQTSLPTITRLAQLRLDWPNVSNAPHLSLDFSERRRQLEDELITVRSQHDLTTDTLARANEAIESVTLPLALLDQSKRIEALHQDLGKHRKAQIDGQKLLDEQSRWKLELQNLVDELNSISKQIVTQNFDLESVRLNRDERKRIDQLVAEHTRIAAQVDDRRIALQSRRATLRDCEEKFTIALPEIDTLRLELAISAAEKAGDIEDRLSQKRNAWSQESRKASKELQRLGLWTGTLQELEILAVPDEETVDRFDQELDDLQLKLNEVQLEVESKQKELNQKQRAIEKLEKQQDVPTEADLASMRQNRDAEWLLICQAIEEKEYETWTLRSQTFSSLIRQADDIGDRLRREAQRVAEKAELLSHRDVLQSSLPNLLEKLQTVNANFVETNERWKGLWRAIGIEPQTPREMRSWLTKHSRLIELAEEVDTTNRDSQQLEIQIDGFRKVLIDILATFDQDRSMVRKSEEHESQSLADVIHLAEYRLKSLQMLNAQRLKMEQDGQRLNQEVKLLEIEVAQSEGKFEAWGLEWESALSSLHLKRNATPQQATGMIELIHDIQAKREDIGGHQKRITGIERDAREFEICVQQLAISIPWPQAISEPISTVGTIYEELGKAREIAAQQKTQSLNQQSLQTELDRLQNRQKAIVEKLQFLCREAGIDDPSQLAAIEMQASSRQRLEQEIDDCKCALAALAGGVTLDEFMEQASKEDADRLPAKIKEYQDELACIQQQESAVRERNAVQMAEIQKLDGSFQVAQAFEEREQILAELRRVSEQYAQLKLSSRLLRNAMEAYRKQNQGPVLSHASRIFQALTCGQFAGLEADFDEKDQPILLGIRSKNSGKVLIGGMSEGTCDQLYLALRLASFETWLEHHEPIPFIVDDILVNFDDERSAAALRVLAELSARTQVILLTHHRHLVDLAKKTLESKSLHLLTWNQGN